MRIKMIESGFIHVDQKALSEFIKNEVERLVEVEIVNFKKEISKNYYFDDCLISREEVAKKLGVSLGTIDNLRKRGRIQSYRIGNSVKFKKSEVLEYIKHLQINIYSFN